MFIYYKYKSLSDDIIDMSYHLLSSLHFLVIIYCYDVGLPRATKYCCICNKDVRLDYDSKSCYWI